MSLLHGDSPLLICYD